jgi:TIR domain
MKIFLSHKGADEEFVKAIVKAFRESDVDRVKVFTSPSIDTAGNDYRAAIAAELTDSDCVMLLYTDAALPWDWSLYECGYFHGHHRDKFVVRAVDDKPYSGRRLFIIHKKGIKRPAPLENWESIEVDTDGLAVDLDNLTPLQAFLERLFFQGSFGLEPPVLRQVGSAKADQLIRLSEPLIAALKGYAQRPNKIAPIFAIEIPENPRWPQDGDDLPEGTMISSNDRRAFNALGVDPHGKSRVPWSEVRDELKDRLQTAWPFWSRTLVDSLRDLLEDRSVDSALPLLRKTKDRLDTWRPVLDEVSRERKGTWVITILLADVATAIERLPRDAVGSITRLLWMERMFNYGIVEDYKKRFMEKRGQNEVGKPAWFDLISEFRRALNMVYAEALNMGYNRDDVAAALTRTQREVYQRTIQQWEKCQPLIDAFCRERDATKSWETFENLFEELQSMASRMYQIAGKRLATLAESIPQSLFAASEADNGRARATTANSPPRPKRRKESG